MMSDIEKNESKNVKSLDLIEYIDNGYQTLNGVNDIVQENIYLGSDIIRIDDVQADAMLPSDSWTLILAWAISASLSQLVRRIITSSANICTDMAHMIPIQRPLPPIFITNAKITAAGMPIA